MSSWHNWRVGPMEVPTDEQWARLHVRTMEDPRVKKYCEGKLLTFCDHPKSCRNAEDVEPFDWLTKDLDGLDSADAWDFSDDVAPERTRKARRVDKEEAQLQWPAHDGKLRAPAPDPASVRGSKLELLFFSSGQKGKNTGERGGSGGAASSWSGAAWSWD